VPRYKLPQTPQKYHIGRGEQGVLIAESYRREILPYWQFASPEKAKKSTEKILELFENYKRDADFIGMDMARKFRHMGFTCSRRYANHTGGKKYDGKAEPARIFYVAYQKTKDDPEYLRLKAEHKERYE
jgi:hypothetical protein